MPTPSALYGVGVYGASVYNRIMVASSAVIPVEAQGYLLAPAPNVTTTLVIPRGLPSESQVHQSPKRAQIRITEGTTFRWGFNIIDQVGKPVNLAGAIFTWVMYARNAPATSASPILTKTLANFGIIMLDSPGGSAMLSFSPTDTTDRPGSYDWELQMVENNGDVWLPGLGLVIVTPSHRYGQ